MSAALGSLDRLLRVAIVGAGPSGFYTAAALLARKDLAVSIDLIDRLPTPYGLVRYGVAPDHPKIKLVIRVFEKICLDPRVRYLGNVDYGRDLSLADLRRCYDQVVFAVGGQSDRRLGIPGEDLANSLSSTAFVAWYSRHPDFLDLAVDLGVESAAVVGIGNVAIDVARVLARDPEELAATDISDDALAALRASRVRDVHVLARRGPVQAKCSPAELKELGELAGVDLLVEPRDLELDAASEAELAADAQAQKNLDLLRAFAERGATGAERRIHLRFLASPLELEPDGGRVARVAVERNRLVERRGGVAAEGTGEIEKLPAGLVVRAVGYRSLPLPDLPFDERRGVVPNAGGRVLDPASGETLAGLYVAGWVKRGPTGLIGSNKPDGAETAAAMVEDLAGLAGAAEPDPAAVDRLLAGRGARVVDFPAWQRLDRIEVERGRPLGRPRVKMGAIAEMLAALDGGA
ncbi:MAG TPA: FAD-dependent oxidoreductase [Thermoanaerobaculia bacterium]|nr:FAD-dependent oxidoreductase [Thermoanaerobaculia bacterium]